MLTKAYPSINNRLEVLCHAREEAEAALQMSKKCISETVNGKVREFEMGQPVWLSTKNIKIRHINLKLGNCRLGPFEVVEKTGSHTYCLALPYWMKIHDNIHVDQLSPWKGNKVNGVEPAPPEPEVVDGEEFWEVDKILDSRISGWWKKLQFLVRWKGYGEGHESWEPEGNLVGTSDEAIADFYRTHPSAPQKISASAFHSLPWQPYENLTTMAPQS